MEQMVDGTRGTTARTLKAGDLVEHADWIDAVMAGREEVEHKPGSDYHENQNQHSLSSHCGLRVQWRFHLR